MFQPTVETKIQKHKYLTQILSTSQFQHTLQIGYIIDKGSQYLLI